MLASTSVSLTTLEPGNNKPCQVCYAGSICDHHASCPGPGRRRRLIDCSDAWAAALLHAPPAEALSRMRPQAPDALSLPLLPTWQAVCCAGSLSRGRWHPRAGHEAVRVERLPGDGRERAGGGCRAQAGRHRHDHVHVGHHGRAASGLHPVVLSTQNRLWDIQGLADPWPRRPGLHSHARMWRSMALPWSRQVCQAPHMGHRKPLVGHVAHGVPRAQATPRAW